MTIPTALSGLLGPTPAKPMKASELMSAMRSQITINALSTSTNYYAQHQYEQKTSLSNLRHYVADHVGGPAGDALQAQLITIEGIYAMSARDDENAPNPVFSLLGGKDSQWRNLPAGSLISKLF